LGTALCIDRFRLGRKAVPRNGVIAPGDWRRREQTLCESESVQSSHLTTMQDQLLLGLGSAFCDGCIHLIVLAEILNVDVAG